ncbi:hypothetical protein P3X46_030552 [Hevea brasiliensis]|uniref:DUF3741 domain-containing protein n=1 Tax=Hevea brasiliensis TaxID=3981 RepID=A0ABQ9KIU2_HEVBR|nr:uncharacterized protein LOC110658172 isoform X2 [Hevea brasiliensis]KAJ9139857.1 hypothetical protein P3X46_030552 [Hevea brasiliensis]
MPNLKIFHEKLSTKLRCSERVGDVGDWLNNTGRRSKKLEPIHYHVGWKTNVSKAPRKEVLGDLSNSLKPSLNRASKKQNSSIFSLSEKETGAFQNALDVPKQKSTSKASGKVQTSGRKALSDISNSGKPNRNEESKNCNAKLSVVAEESIDANAIAEETFLHNHQECIKAQARSMGLDQFLETIGLDNVFSKRQANHMSIKAQSPQRHLKMEEMKEQLFEDGSWIHNMSSKLDSPPACSTPKSARHYMRLDYNFKLLESP